MGSKWRLEDGHRERAPGAQPPPSAAAWSGPRGEGLLLPPLSLSLAGPGWTRKTLEVPGQPGFDSQTVTTRRNPGTRALALVSG